VEVGSAVSGDGERVRHDGEADQVEELAGVAAHVHKTALTSA
jgi:hypothetical protein